MDALVHLRKKIGEENAGESVLATLLWGMLYADDAEVVSQSPEQQRKMMGVIVVVCAAFTSPYRRATAISGGRTYYIALYLGPRYYIHINNNYNIVTLLVF